MRNPWPLLLSLALCVGCPGGDGGGGGGEQPAPQPQPQPEPARATVAAPLEEEPAPSGPPFVLGEATAPGQAWEATPQADAKPLDDAATQALLDRLPALEKEPGAEFARREGPPPPPLTGETVQQPFPPPPGPPPAEVAPSGPLEVVRHMPEGDVPLAPHLSITFSHPMIPVGTLDAVAQEKVPVRLVPQPAGRWRWIGTRTLLFEPESRFPMATEFTVEVPAGAAAADGATLAAPVRWTFRTPPPKLVRGSPQGGPVRRDPTFVATFDQEIDPAAVLAAAVVRAGDATVAVRAATAAELDAVATQLQPGRSVAFVAEAPLPADATVTVTFGPGTPSAEGPRRTTEPASFTLRTFGPLRVTEHRSGWGRGDCPPGAPFMITFSNPIDADALTPDMITLAPEVPGLRVTAHGSTVQLQGATAANTRYEATLSPALKDVFGQTLGAQATLGFATTAPHPALVGQAGDMVILDPAGKPRLTFTSISVKKLRARVHAVDPATDWAAYQEWRRGLWRDATPPMPGRKVSDVDVSVKGSQEAWAETTVDLSAALKDGLGHAVVLVEPVDWPARDYGRRPRLAAWVQGTRLGLDAQHDATDLLAWVTQLADGAPVAGAQVRLLPTDAQAETGADGVARLILRPPARSSDRALLASLGADVALLPGDWSSREPGGELRWFTFDDRHLYRPGEQVRVKGWVRHVDHRVGGDVRPAPANLTTTRFVVRDARWQEVTRGEARFDPLGGFDLDFTLPDTVHVGQAVVEFDRGHHHAFQIAEFRRPEFEVTVSPAGAGPALATEDAVFTAAAAYFAGGALPGAKVTWRATARPTHFTPPNRRDFLFGEHVPWWLRGWSAADDIDDHPRRGRRLPGRPSASQDVATLAGTTDAQGKHHLRVTLNRLARPLAITAEATVQDVNRQAFAGASTVLAHPAAEYVGLRPRRPFFRQGDPLALDLLVVGLDGVAVAGRAVHVELARLEWDWDHRGLRERVVERHAYALTSATDLVSLEHARPAGGTWRITARARDAAGRVARTTTQLWVAGGAAPATREVEEAKVTLVPDRETYAHGDTAEVLVVAPFAPAEALVTLRRSGLVRHERLRLETTTHVLEVPIDDALVPDVTLHVALVGAAPREDAPGTTRPAFAAGQVTLSVPPRRRTLALEVAPARRDLEPGGTTAVDLVVRDHAGEPVRDAEVCLAVVDEAVLMLAGHAIPDPLGVFYAPRGPGAGDARARRFLRLQAPDLASAAEDLRRASAEEAMDGAPAPMAARAGAPGGAVGGGGDAAPPIALRKDLSPIAHWSPRVRTDGAGRAKVDLKLPDSLTRWRLVAVAAAGDASFGAREETVTARLPLMVRPSAPRFLNFGDRFELPVVVQNQTDAPLEVDVAVRASNLALTAGQGRRLTIPARDRREVRFPAAADRAGRARLQVVAAVTATPATADAQELTLPVWTPATSEAFATYGILDDGALAQPIAPPTDAWPEFGGLEVTTSSTQLQALTDAVIYLVEYPFGCAEQVASRVLALVAVRDVLQAFAAPQLPSEARLAEAVAADLGRLRELQHPSDGGWGFWRQDEPSWPYLSLHVLHALARAKEKGYPVEPGMLRRAHDYARQVEKRIPSYYSVESRRALIAYALHVRARLGDADPARARSLLREGGGVAAVGQGLSFEAAGWLYPLLRQGAPDEAKALRRHLGNRVVETAGAAHFVTGYSDGAHVLLHSAHRVDGVLLEALLDDPAEVAGDLAPKLVQGLLGHRRRGRWTNTQENAFVLLALDAYFRAAEKVTPDFVARAWLGEAFAGEHAFRGRTTERARIDVPMATLQTFAADGAPPRLTLAKDGPGRLYYRVGLRYAPRDLALAPLDAGFSVERRYEAVDDAGDVRRDPDGTWRIKAGARVRVHLTMIAQARRHHVALVDPLPAGLEPLDPALRATGALSAEAVTAQPGPGCGWWWWTRTWYEHSGLRDERAEAFTSLLWEGVHTFSYTARATTPGTFVAPPAKAEEMYAPETFGRSGSDRVVVE